MIIFDVLKSSDALLYIFQLHNLAGLDFGVLSDRNLASRAQNGKNELKKINQASTAGLRCLGDPPDPPIDISCIWTRSELFRMENLAVTSV